MADSAEKTTRERASLRPLASLGRYVKRYRGLVAGAGIALVTAAVTTLTLPLAVRRMVDHGFTAADGQFIDTYFSMLVVLAIVLALASAARYYFVITLGERVVADLRREVFDHVTRLSPSFFDVNQSGEIVSRLTADTTQIKSAVGATASVALRNMILCLGAIVMMVYTSPKLSSLVLLAIPLIVFPLVGFGRSVRRRSREAQTGWPERQPMPARRSAPCVRSKPSLPNLRPACAMVRRWKRPSARPRQRSRRARPLRPLPSP